MQKVENYLCIMSDVVLRIFFNIMKNRPFKAVAL